ncbi:PTS glucose transporter subunit IIA [Cellulomonas sp. RIT-PI-Y]|uniref:PTS sugar transporter subunit IIA n=1 Tax=Cellulomonas sp. RIT-PI-Y TaxID=3035297 RepID=UPI0021D87667|nr:PTS glucose transporter subunit IIA [Cellulomonas sp. RIT-PI-Y]
MALFGRRKTLTVTGPTEVVSPVTGTVVALADCGDPAFAAGLLGPGTAVRPDSGEVVSPVSGQVISAMPHAYGVRAADGAEVLVHIGIDTVTLGGAHFVQRVEAGDTVTAGAPLATVDLAAVEAAGLSTTVMVVVPNADAVGPVEVAAPGPVTAGTTVLTVRS